MHRDAVLLLDGAGFVWPGNACHRAGRPDSFWTGDASVGNPGGHFPRSGWLSNDLLSAGKPSEAERKKLPALLMSFGEEDQDLVIVCIGHHQVGFTIAVEIRDGGTLGSTTDAQR